MAHLIPVHVLQTIDGELAAHPPISETRGTDGGNVEAREPDTKPDDTKKAEAKPAGETYAEALLNSDKIMVVETIDAYTVITLDDWKQIVVKEPAAHVAMLTRGQNPPAA